MRNPGRRPGAHERIAMSDRKRTKKEAAESRRRESEQKYQTVVNKAREGILVIKDGIITFLNPYISELLDLPEDEIVSSPFLEFVHPDDQGWVQKRLSDWFGGADIHGETEFRINTSSGVEKWVVTNTALISWEDELAALSFVTDITDRKSAAEDLLRSETSLSRAQEISHLGSWEWDITSGGLWWSDEVYRIFGLVPQEFGATYEAFLERVHPDDRESVSISVERAVNEGEKYDIEHRVVRPDGSERIVNEVGEVEYDDSGRVVKMIGMVLDITERKIAAEKIDRLSEIVEQAEAPIFITDPAGIIEYSNPAFTTITGFTREDAIGKTPRILQSGQMSKEYYEQVWNAIKSGEPVSAVVTNKRKNGEIWYYDQTIIPLKDENGLVTHFVSTGKDITDRIQTEEELKKKETQQSLVLDSLPMAFYIAQPFGDYGGTWVSDQIDNLSGYNASEFSEDIELWASRLHPEDRDRAFQAFEGITETDTVTVEYRWQHADGHYIWFLDHGVLSRDKDGSPREIIGTWLEITQQKEAEQELRDKEEKYRQVIEYAGQSIFVAQDGCIKFQNPRTLSITGYTEDDLQSRPFVEFVHPEDREMVVDRYKRRIAGEELTDSTTWRILIASGEERWVEVNSVRIDWEGEPATLNFMSDITARKRAEQELNILSEVVKNSPQYIVITDPNGAIEYINPAFSKVTGYTSEEVIGQNPRILQSGETPDEVYEDLWSTVLSGKLWRGKLKNRRKDGSLFWERATISPITDSEGEINHLVAVKEDITERMDSEEALRASEVKFETAFRSSPDSITITNLHTGLIVETNEGFVRLMEYELNETIGRTTLDLGLWAEPEQRDEFVALLQSDGSVTGCEARLRAKSGIIKDTEISAELIDIKGEQHLLAVTRDITQRKKTEQELREKESELLQSQKLEAIGQLAGGVAHDFNNMLGIIIGYGDLALTKMDPDDPLRKNLENINNAAQRAARLTQQLLIFSRKQTIQPVAMNVNEAVKGTGKLLHRLIGEEVELKIDLAERAGVIEADPGQIDQILVNLAVNARDAMPEGGELTIETDEVEVTAERIIHIEDIDPGPYVRITISDTGTGMSEATISHIFEPFFTTKAKGRGTGLGLSTVYGIVKQSGGFIHIESELGKGSSFEVLFPRFEGITEAEDSEDRLDHSGCAGKTILVVEDDPAFRQMVIEMLTEFQCDVIEARSGNAALFECEKREESIDAMLTDVVMPGMSGAELADRVSALQPEMKVVYMSGYTDDAIGKHGVLDPDVHFIEKPFTADALAKKFKELFETMDSEGT